MVPRGFADGTTRGSMLVENRTTSITFFKSSASYAV
jgi:hypothetical protein